MSKGTMGQLMGKLYNHTFEANKWDFIEAKLSAISLAFLLTYWGKEGSR